MRIVNKLGHGLLHDLSRIIQDFVHFDYFVKRREMLVELFVVDFVVSAGISKEC